eukprot:TRINITY_DN19740_c0_g1_i1.p1 TRINITY_DN19740_c0_g1~~TRINITY_DN19740_c0_g1_i1.p1  ORF type:complete len:253 (+),score=110.54 TRINITY_DN19740_c0_g1_i1:275-1033(+)
MSQFFGIPSEHRAVEVNGAITMVDTGLQLQLRSDDPKISRAAPLTRGDRRMVVHYQRRISRFCSKGTRLSRILQVSDRALYILKEDGTITRCVPVSIINEVIWMKGGSLAFRIPSEKYDLYFEMGSSEEARQLLHILRSTYKYCTGTSPLDDWVVESSDANRGKNKFYPPLSMVKPAGWSYSQSLVQVSMLAPEEIRKEDDASSNDMEDPLSDSIVLSDSLFSATGYSRARVPSESTSVASDEEEEDEVVAM